MFKLNNLFFRIYTIVFIFVFVILLFSGCSDSHNTELLYPINPIKKRVNLGEGDYHELIVLKIAHSYSEAHPQHVALNEIFAPIVEQQSNWNIRVELYPQNILGTEEEFIHGVRNGTVEMCIAERLVNHIVESEMNVLTTNQFQNYNEANIRLNNSTSEPSIQLRPISDIVYLYWSFNGFHPIWTFNQHNRSDFPMKIATNLSELPRLSLESAGFSPVSVEMCDITMLLEERLINGHDYPILTSYFNGWHKELRHIYITRHALDVSLYLMNEKLWNSISDKYRKIIMDAVIETIEYEIILLTDMENKILHELRDEGYIIHNL